MHKEYIIGAIFTVSLPIIFIAIILLIIHCVMCTEIEDDRYRKLRMYKEYITTELNDDYISNYEYDIIINKVQHDNKQKWIKDILQVEKE